jgi:hypothetical protein
MNTDRFDFVLALRAEIPRALYWGVGNDLAIAQLATRLIRRGKLLHRIAEMRCDGDSDPESLEQRWTITKNSVRVLLAPYDIEPMFSGDPRGCCLKLKFPSGRTNDFGNEGWCVPS